MRSNTVCVAVYQLPHRLSSKEQILGTPLFLGLKLHLAKCSGLSFLDGSVEESAGTAFNTVCGFWLERWVLAPWVSPQLSWQQGSCFPLSGQWERGHTAPWSWKWRHVTSAIFLSSSNSGATWEECTVHGSQRHDSSGVILQTATGTQIKSLRTNGVQNIHCALEFSKYFHKKRSFRR